jgi:hypothetical protein
MGDEKSWSLDKLVERTVQALKSNFFDAVCFDTRSELIDAVAGLVEPGMEVGLGGSTTIRSDLGLPEKIRERGGIILDHWQAGLSKEENLAVRRRQLTCDLFIASANAITEKGEIVNVDGVGNRVAGTVFGPKKVVIIAGYNKIVPDLNGALERIKQVAGPMNAKRLGLSALPCAKTGHCHDCRSEERMCRVICIMQRKPSLTDLSVFLLKEDMGF